MFSIKKELIPPLLLVFVNILGFSVLIPVLPFIVKQYGISQVWYGILLSSYSAALFIGAPFMGALSDHFGRKKLLLLSHLGTLLSWFIFAIAYFLDPKITILTLPLPIVVILFSRLLDGVTGGNTSVVNGLITDIVEPQNRGTIFSIMGAVFGIGFMFGPLIGALTSQSELGYIGTIIFSIFTSIVTLISIIFFLKDYKNNDSVKDINELKSIIFRKTNVFKMIYSHKENTRVIRAFLTRFVLSLVLVGFSSLIPLYFIDEFSADQRMIGVALFVIGIYSIFNQGLIVSRMIKKIEPEKVILVGMIFVSIGLFVVSFISDIKLFIAFAYLYSLGTSLIDPAIKTIISNNSSSNMTGEVLGLDASISSLSRAIVPLISTMIYVSMGRFSFLLFSGLIVLSVFLLRYIHETSSK